MKKLFFTMTGCQYRYGLGLFKPGMTVTLVKEPDNRYDHEAIRIELDGLGTVGYVANSPNTVRGTSMSAGRLYDKIEDRVSASILYVLSDSVLCYTEVSGEGILAPEISAAADIDLYSQETLSYLMPSETEEINITQIPVQSQPQKSADSELSDDELVRKLIGEMTAAAVEAPAVQAPAPAAEFPVEEAQPPVVEAPAAKTPAAEEIVSPADIASALSSALAGLTPSAPAEPAPAPVAQEKPAEAPQAIDFASILSGALSAGTMPSAGPAASAVTTVAEEAPAPVVEEPVVEAPAPAPAVEEPASAPAAVDVQQTIDQMMKNEQAMAALLSSGLNAADFASVLSGALASGTKPSAGPAASAAAAAEASAPAVEIPITETQPPVVEAPAPAAEAPAVEELPDRSTTSSPGLSFNTMRFPEEDPSYQPPAAAEPPAPVVEAAKPAAEVAEVIEPAPEEIPAAEAVEEAAVEFVVEETEPAAEEAPAAVAEEPAEEAEAAVELEPDTASASSQTEEEEYDLSQDRFQVDESELDDNLAKLHLGDIDKTYLSESFLENLRNALKEH